LSKKTFGDLYAATIEKRKILENQGFNVVEMWESDWLELNDKKFHKPLIESSNDLSKSPLSHGYLFISGDEFFDCIGVENTPLNFN
jgi:hypothetical protein